MKLNDLIEALAAEIELAQPQLEASLDKLATLDVEDPAFLDALDQYSGQAERMGEAAEMAGFPGLQAVCAHVLENTLFLAATPVEERRPLLEFLRDWPRLMVYYLKNLSDPSTAAGLVDHLRGAPSPMEEEQALKVMHMLGAIPLQVSIPGADDERARRPVLAKTADVALTVPDDVDQKLMEGFFQEAPGQAKYLVDLVRNMVSGQGDSSDVIAAKRVAHTLKGSGAIIGLRGLTSIGHHMEDILEHFERHAEGKVAKPAADALLDAAYCLEQMVGYVTGADDYPQQAQAVLQTVLDVANLIDRGEQLEESVLRAPRTSTEAPGPSSAPAQKTLIEGPGPHVQVTTAAANLRVSLQLVEELFRVSGEVSVTSAAMEARVRALAEQARELVNQNLRVQKRLLELENLVDIRALTMMRARSQRSEEAAFDPLEMDQYSELHSTTHALAEETSDVRVMARRLEEELGSISALQSRQQVLSRDLQHLVIGTRMTEVGVLESRLQRNVRTTAQATSKEATLEIVGGDTLIDSDVLNRLAEPLLHLLRNAVDHGLETPEERLRAGKPEIGHILLTFALQGQQVVLRCEDDGRGLNHQEIYRSAVKKGLVAAGQALTNEEIARLILAPGFSTRDQISEVSGRGVGLDVVHEWVSSMNGIVRVSSVQGQGCAIELRFAASLSTVHSLIVEVQGHRFALPAIHVERAVPRGVGRFEALGGQIFFHYEQEVMLGLHLANLVGLPLDTDKPNEEYDVIIVRMDDKIRAISVDRLLDSRELLVKNPGRFGRHIRGIAGLSIMGDGAVAVNLDMAQLLSGVIRSSQRDQATQTQPEIDRPTQLGVLVVDDALTVRNSLQQLLEDAGFRAETARDGIDAINTLADFQADVVLTDLEMPNMNGVELTAHLRAQEATKKVPVIMITSRSQDKHRRLAEEAGVNVYITKPYNDNDLLQSIRQSLMA